jgi:hypothetical protein
LSVFPAALSFEEAHTEDFFIISNSGTGTLAWSITTNTPWLSFSITEGTATPTDPSEVTITIDPTALPQGIELGNFTITSDGGDIEVPVSVTTGQVIEDPALEVSPLGIDFGGTDTIRNFLITNAGSGSFDYTITENVSWITTITPSSGTVSSTATVVQVVVNRAGLQPGIVSGDIVISAGEAGEATVTATMSAGVATGSLEVDVSALDFGDASTSRVFTLANTGGSTLTFTATNTQPWLALSSNGGQISVGQSLEVTATVNRDGLTASNYIDTITLSDGSITIAINVTMVVAPTGLVVQPTNLAFGTGFARKIFSVSNAGAGEIDWDISGPFEPWLTVTPTNGTVGNEPQFVMVEIDRSLLEAGVYSTSFTVDAGAEGSELVTITALVFLPEIDVESAITDHETGLPLVTPAGFALVELGTNLESADFFITNTGNGTLNWNIDPDTLEEWMLMDPISGSLAEGERERVTVLVNRDREAAPYAQQVPIRTNATNVDNGVTFADISMQVEGVVAIGAEPTVLNLGLFDNVTSFAVANFGDPDTILNFQIANDRDWLFQNPSTGFSLGLATPPPFKDWRVIDVAIDRAELEGTGGSGTFTIIAVDEEGETITNIEPQLVTLAVEAAPLTFEQGLAQTRVPSIVRYTFNMRDIDYASMGLTPDLVPVDSFQIFEQDVPLEVAETNQFLTDRYRTNVVIALDFSGSMFEAAESIGLKGGDPLQEAYIQTVIPFIEALPDDYNIALVEFHERFLPIRVLQAFTQNKQDVIDALSSDLRISDHGATTLLPSLIDTMAVLSNANGVFNTNQHAHVNALVLVSDGRGNTTRDPSVPEIISDRDVIDTALSSRARFFSMAWGRDPNNQLLAGLAAETGGHHYSVRGNSNGDPIVDELGDNLQQLALDLQQHLVLTYNSLNEENGRQVRVNAAVDSPFDSSGALPGTFEQIIDFEDIAGDVFLGQVAIEASPQANGEIIARISADYIPRNINKMQFTLSADGTCFPSNLAANPAGITFTVRQTAAEEGGIISDWVADAGNTAGATTMGTYRFDSPDGAPLAYSNFGELLEVVFPAGTPMPFSLCMTFDNTIYAVDVEPKYFTSPDSIRVRNQTSVAPSFPAPFMDTDLTTEDSDLVVSLGTDIDSFPILVANAGGNYNYPIFTGPGDVQLVYEIFSADIELFDISLDGAPFVTESTIRSPLTPETLTVELDRTNVEGDYAETIQIQYGAGSIQVGGFINITVFATILPPEISPAEVTANLGNVATEFEWTIQNIGQSTLEWIVDTESGTIPDWATVSPTSGITTDENDNILVDVDRAAAPSGLQEFTFVINSNGGTQTVDVSAQIQDPFLTVDDNLFDLGDTSTSATLFISNTGQSTLEWFINQDDLDTLAGWLTLSLTAGETTTSFSSLGISVDRTGLAAGTYTETFTVESNGGSQLITVSVDVP